MRLHTILGAGGSVGNQLVTILLSANEAVRLVSRHPKPVAGTTAVAADLTNYEQTLAAVKGSSIVYLLAGLPYDSRIWEKNWPVIMSNTIDACKEADSKLIFLDNVYMYGRVNGVMTENTPFNPCSKKGKIRAAIATQLLTEMQAGTIKALIARAADFYGPSGEKTSMPNILVFSNHLKKKKAQWLGDITQPHAYTYIPDIAEALYLLANNEHAFGQTWHLPTSSRYITGNELISLSAAAFQTAEGHFTFPKWMIALAGIFNRDIYEMKEMLYQNIFPYQFDATKFSTTFHFKPTDYEDGIKQTAAYYLSK